LDYLLERMLHAIQAAYFEIREQFGLKENHMCSRIFLVNG
jgi:hypothetical protein